MSWQTSCIRRHSSLTCAWQVLSSTAAAHRHVCGHLLLYMLTLPRITAISDNNHPPFMSSQWRSCGQNLVTWLCLHLVLVRGKVIIIVVVSPMLLSIFLKNEFVHRPKCLRRNYPGYLLGLATNPANPCYVVMPTILASYFGGLPLGGSNATKLFSCKEVSHPLSDVSAPESLLNSCSFTKNMIVFKFFIKEFIHKVQQRHSW